MDEMRFEWMRPHQIRECRQKADIAFLPLGSLEWHGVQNPIGTDALKTHYICCLAAKKIGGGAVVPPLIWGMPRDSFYMGLNSGEDIADDVARAFGTTPDRFRGSGRHGGMDEQEQWLFYQRLLRMTLEHIAGFGFRSIYICTGHNPLIHWARPVAVTFGRVSSQHGRTVTVDVGGEYDAAQLSGDHAGKWETSLMMAADPASVDLAEIERNPAYVGVGAGTDAIEASAAQGAAWADACAEAIAHEARWLVEHYPTQPPRHHHRR